MKFNLVWPCTLFLLIGIACTGFLRSQGTIVLGNRTIDVHKLAAIEKEDRRLILLREGNPRLIEIRSRSQIAKFEKDIMQYNELYFKAGRKRIFKSRFVKYELHNPKLMTIYLTIPNTVVLTNRKDVDEFLANVPKKK